MMKKNRTANGHSSMRPTGKGRGGRIRNIFRAICGAALLLTAFQCGDDYGYSEASLFGDWKFQLCDYHAENRITGDEVHAVLTARADYRDLVFLRDHTGSVEVLADDDADNYSTAVFDWLLQGGSIGLSSDSPLFGSQQTWHLVELDASRLVFTMEVSDDSIHRRYTYTYLREAR